MRDFFSLDGPVLSFLSRAADMVILNILFIVCSLPVVTIGASLTAMSYVTLKMKDGEEGYVWKSFFHSFKQNFRQATGMWLIFFAVGAVLGLDAYIVHNAGGTSIDILRIAVFAGIILWVMVASWAFPLLSRFENTVKTTIKNAIFLAMGKAPQTLLFVLFIGLAFFATSWNAYTLVWGILVWLLIGFSLLSFINSSMQHKTILGLMPKEDRPDTEIADEPWHADSTASATGNGKDQSAEELAVAEAILKDSGSGDGSRENKNT